jgi:hypothetical protein
LRSVHMQDLVHLDPTDEELSAARAWVLSQDAGDRWPALVAEAVEYAKRHR